MKLKNTLKILLPLLLLSMDAQALVGSYNVKILDLTNPVGADVDSSIEDVSERGGYSIHCDLTGTLQMTGTIYASNQKVVAPATRAFTSISGSTQAMTVAGFIYDVPISNASYIKLKVGTFVGAGTAKCYLTTKDI
jgi:hypothetical protein